VIAAPEAASPAERDTMRGILWMLVAVAGLGGIAISVRALKPDIEVPQLLFLRALIGLIVITPFAVSNGWRGMISHRPGFQVVRNITHVAAQYCVFFAIITVPLAEVTSIEYTIPMMTAGMAALTLGEKVSRYRWYGMAASFCGVLMIIRPGFAEVQPAVLMVVLGAIFFALNNVMVKKLSMLDSASTMVFNMNAIQIVLLIIPALYVWVMPEWRHVPWILGLGLSGMITHYCMSRALVHADTSVLFPLDFLRLPFIAVIAWAFWGETFSAWVVAGALVIFTSTYITTRRETRGEKTG